ncbi:hypothetical protein [Aeromicrobium ginsengisoli]|uniref:Sensor domain-containing protein n=1 Tax=Aeromicrobium ginsengisoli TaxID=363867 RepID=A0A5M4FDZ3_9ACTN|nr:hypothetical protein [Aeromicrobium ginsengisoli]KAA1397472.1 hypothetical protein ESP70_008835 [Aeromicrobium ginsengisoli]
MRTRQLVCIAALVVVSACGGGGSDSGSDKPAASAPLSKAKAQKALLTIADFESDWKAAPVDDTDAAITITKGDTSCSTLANGPDDKAPTKVESSFSRADEASMNDTVESYGDSSKATTQWRAHLKAISACRTFTIGGSGTPSVDVEVTPTEVSDLGDEAAAFHATGTVQGVTMNLDLVTVRAGRNVVAITTLAFNDQPPRDTLEEKVTTMLDRLDAVDDAS